MKKLIYCLLLLPLLLLLTGCSFDGSSIHDSAVANHTDLSISYLQMVFGDVGNILQGSSGQMLGMLFKKFNQGVLCVAGLWLAYTIFTLLMQAVEGQFQQKKPHVILLRVALGIALIIPNATTGYSAIQDILMNVVVEGVSLANMVWNSALGYMQEGGGIWHQPNTVVPHSSGSYSDLFDDAMGAPSDWQGGSDTTCVFGTTCMSGTDASSPIDQHWNQKIQRAPLGTKIFLLDACMFAKSLQASEYVPLSPKFGTVDNQPALLFPGSLDTGDSTCGNIPLNLLKDNSKACNISGWDDHMNDTDTSYSGDVDQAMTRCIYIKQAVQQMANDIMPAAKRLICSKDTTNQICKSYSTSDDITTDISQTMLSAFLSYITAVTPLKNLSTSQSSSDGQSNTRFTDIANEQGWASAGRFYWDIARLQGKFNSSNLDTLPKLQPMEAHLAKDSIASQIVPLTKIVLFDGQSGNTAPSFKTLMDKAKYSLSVYTGTNQKGNTGSDDSSTRNSETNSFRHVFGMLTILMPFVASVMDIVKLFLSFTTNPMGGLGADPIVWLSSLGFTMMGTAINLYITAAGTSMMLASIAAICDADVNTMDIFKTGLDFLTPLFWCAVGPLFVVGASFGYFLPLYPYLLFTFGVISWLIAVIEAMVAAPLVAFGLTHPDGHDFLGQAQQSLMLGLSIFLRPTLMVIGLIAGMIVSYVSLRIVLFSFDSFLTDLYTNSPAYSSTPETPLFAATSAVGHVYSQFSDLGGLAPGILAVTTIPLLLIAFTSIVYQIVTNAFNLIHLLPSYTLRWLGAPQDPTLADTLKMTQAIEGSVDKSGQQLEKGLSHATSNLSQDMDSANVTPSKNPNGLGAG